MADVRTAGCYVRRLWLVVNDCKCFQQSSNQETSVILHEVTSRFIWLLSPYLRGAIEDGCHSSVTSN